MLFRAALAAWRQVFSPAFRGILWRSLLLTAGLMVLAWAGLKWLLAAFLSTHTLSAQYTAIDGYVLLLSSIGIAFLFIYLLPAVTAIVASFFLDDAAAIVESSDFPHDPKGTPLSLANSLKYGLRFAGLSLLVNLAALILFFIPGINLVSFFLANAYLLGREYFEMAAVRFVPPATATQLRKAHSLSIFGAGAIMAFLMMIPILNLITPLFGIALMVHIQKRTRAQP